MDLLELNVFYNGQFKYDGNNCEYVNGEMAKLSNFSGVMNYCDFIQRINETLNLNDLCKFYYKVTGDAFVNLYCDESIKEMKSWIKKGNIIDIYVDHVIVGEEEDDLVNEEVNLDEIGGQELEEQVSDENDSKGDEYLGSEYSDFNEWSSSFKSGDEDDSEDATIQKGRYTEFDPRSDKPHFSVGMMFPGPMEFKAEVTKYAIENSKDIKFIKNEISRVRAICNWPGCTWVLFASTDKQTNHFVVKSFYSIHKCVPSFKCSRVTAPYIAKKYEDRIKSQRGWKLREMRDTIKADMSVIVDLSKCRRAKLIVMKKELECYKAEYARIWDYAHALHNANKGNTIRVNVKRSHEGDPYFWRMYVCFDACKKGFLAGCRHVLGLDGCFSKGPIKFEILSVIGRDGNNQMYPIAWAIVDVENTENWRWFLQLLGQDLDMGSGHGWSLISDQQKGLEKCIKLHLPHAEHRMCARHLYDNLKKKHKGASLKSKFWACARSYSISQFEENLGLFQIESKEAVIDLLKTDPIHWSRAYFNEEGKCDNVDNNLSESFNKWILDVRHKSIITMLEEIRCMVMERIAKLAIQGQEYEHPICPKIVAKLTENINRIKKCKLQWNGKYGYEVTENVKNEKGETKENIYVVDMEKLVCSCRIWNISGIPCSHAICAIYHMNREPMDFVSSWFTTTLHQKTYSYFLEPIVGEHDWPTTQYDRPLPPPQKRMPGRPKKNKRREEGVVTKPTPHKLTRMGQIITCRVCRKEGHNKATCPQNKMGDSSAKRKRGRKNKINVGECSKKAMVGTNESNL